MRTRATRAQMRSQVRLATRGRPAHTVQSGVDNLQLSRAATDK